jgi:CHASE3 domain sensor protein
MHKKTLLDREKQIRFMLDMKWGHGTYDELSDMRKKMREERRQQEHARIETKRQIANNAVIGGLSLAILGVLGGGVYLLMIAL